MAPVFCVEDLKCTSPDIAWFEVENIRYTEFPIWEIVCVDLASYLWASAIGEVAIEVRPSYLVLSIFS